MPAQPRTLTNCLTGRAAALDARITTFEAATVDSLGWQLCAVDASSTDDVHVVGRVCTDCPGVKAMEGSLFLEGSCDGSGGARVPLDLCHLPSFSLFPGQVIAVRGRNPTGRRLSAHEIVHTLPPVPAPAAERVRNAVPCGTLIVAAGPFTEAGNLEFRPLAHLLAHCSAAPPHALILIGPFLPEEHAALLQSHSTFDDLFQSRVCTPTPDASVLKGVDSVADFLAVGACPLRRCDQHAHRQLRHANAVGECCSARSPSSQLQACSCAQLACARCDIGLLRCYCAACHNACM